MVKYLEHVGAIVSGVPTTGIQSGKGYAEITGLQYNQFLIKDRSMGRTFILQNDQQRLAACRKKYILIKRLNVHRTMTGLNKKSVQNQE